ncbi:hypothetical protein JTE90_011383 [Oedothorax gibbosus]|uniref:adenosine kinase n=1 Tax=Oedothorax gibbosus TaxID=931172 RepID=A0AAV6VNY0_9ARAC|nr:hypothetical protein JTE90_011383 [Oedothorax gibbosus]
MANTDDKTNQDDPVRLLFVGAPMLDISADCDDDLLRRFGLKEDDCVRAGPEHDPLFQRLFVSDESRMAAGGSAQNAARVAKWTLGPRGEVAFAGCAGFDDFESWMRLKLESEGVIPLYVHDPMNNTGVCACLLTPRGERSMCARQGAAALFNTHHLNTDVIQQHFRKAHCVAVEGYFIVHSPDVVLEMAQNHNLDQIFSLSLSAEYVCRSHAEQLSKVIPMVEVLMGNEAEVLTFAIAKGASKDVTVEEAVRILREIQISRTSHNRFLIVTRGSKPVILVDESNELKEFDVPNDLPVVDSVGCGDAMSGAFLATYVLDRNVEAAVRAGIQAATHILQVPGCDPTMELAKTASTISLRRCVSKNVAEVDSVGCGDAKSGAFLGTYVLDRDVEAEVRESTQPAALILQERRYGSLPYILPN